MKIAAAKAIANLVTPEQLRVDYIMPSALDVAKVVVDKKLTNKKNINLNKVRENIHSLFIDETLGNVDN